MSTAGAEAAATQSRAGQVRRRRTNQKLDALCCVMTTPLEFETCISRLHAEVDVLGWEPVRVMMRLLRLGVMVRLLRPLRWRGARGEGRADIRARRDPSPQFARPLHKYFAGRRASSPPGRRRCGRRRKGAGTRRAPR